MSTLEAKLLGALRRHRRGVVAALLPALLAWVTTGSACVTLEHGAPAHADHAAHGSHAGHHGVDRLAPKNDTPCPHCPSGGTPAVAAHACANTGDAAAKVTGTPLPDAKPPLVALHWAPLPSTPAPPLIRLTALPHGGALFAHVPLTILHCVLQI